MYIWVFRHRLFCQSGGNNNKWAGIQVVRFTGCVLALLAFTYPGLSGAEALSTAHDFTFKRVKVGQAPGGKRITVQIDPAEQQRLLAALPKVDPDGPTGPDVIGEPAAKPDAVLDSVTPQASHYDWYWDMVPSGQGDVDGRFVKATAALSLGPGGVAVAAPRLQSMQNLADTFGTEILKATIGTDVSPALVLAVMGIESAGDPTAISSAGAMGLMQLIPDTAARFGVTDSSDPIQNIKGGVAYLNWLLGEFNRDPVMVLAAYNAGEGAVKANQGVPPYAETRDYVPKVLAAWIVARGLCLTPPELVTDPCVFKVISASN